MFAGGAATSGAFSFSLRVTDHLAGFADQPYSVNLITTNLPRLAISAGGQIPLLAIGSFNGQTIIILAPSATNYVVQSTTNLSSPDWETASDAVPLTGLDVQQQPARAILPAALIPRSDAGFCQRQWNRHLAGRLPPGSRRDSPKI